MIGFATQGDAIGGIIHQPFYTDDNGQGRSVWGIVNSGVYGKCTLNNKPLPGRIIAGSLSHRSKTVVEAVNACEPTEVLQAGGCGYKVQSFLFLDFNVFCLILVFTCIGTSCSCLCSCFAWL